MGFKQMIDLETIEYYLYMEEQEASQEEEE